MPGLADLEARIEKLEQAADAIRSATREAHEATRDLRAMIKEAREILSSGPVGERIDATVKAGLAEYIVQIRKSTDEATAAVFKRYDDLAAILLDGKPKNLDVSFVDVVNKRRTP